MNKRALKKNQFALKEQFDLQRALCKNKYFISKEYCIQTRLSIEKSELAVVTSYCLLHIVLER